MQYFIKKIILEISVFFLRCIYAILDVFKKLAGISNVTYGGESVSLTDLILFSDTTNLTGTFFKIFVISVGLTCIFLIAAIIKNIVVNKQTLTSMLGKAFGSIFGTLLVFIIVIFALEISSIILNEVDNAFGNSNLVAQIIYNCQGENNRKSLEYITKIVEDGFKSTTTTEYGEFNTGIYYDSFFQDLEYNWWNTYWPHGWDTTAAANLIDTDAYDEWLLFFTSLSVLIALAISCLGLIKRLFDLAFLLLSLPLISSTTVLDDGAKMKLWREAMVSKITMAFGAIIMVNLYIAIIPLLVDVTYIDNDVGNQIIKMLMVIGGAICVPTGQKLFARIMGGSADENKEILNGLHIAGHGTMAVGAAALGAKNILFGGSNRYGRTYQGVFGGIKNISTQRQNNIRDAYQARYGADALNRANDYDLMTYKASGLYKADSKASRKTSRQNYKNSVVNYVVARQQQLRNIFHRNNKDDGGDKQ